MRKARTGASKTEKPRRSAPKAEKPQRSSAGEKKRRLPRWRLILTLLSLLGFCVFFAPVFGGILNVANLAAMTGFLLLAAVFRFWPGFLRLLRRLWARRWGKAFLLVVGGGTGVLLLTLLVLFCLVATKLHAVPKENCPTLIVLGCQVRGTTPSLLLGYRIEAAAAYLTAHPESVAVLSGGMGSGENISEAECMYRSLTAKGISPERLYREAESTSTQENFRFSKALMEREGLCGPVAVVSSDFHIYRALQMAEDIGLDAQGLAACSKYRFSRPTYMLREAMALLLYAFVR